MGKLDKMLYNLPNFIAKFTFICFHIYFKMARRFQRFFKKVEFSCLRPDER